MKILLRVPKLNKKRIAVVITFLISMAIYYHGNKMNQRYIKQKYLNFRNYTNNFEKNVLETKIFIEKLDLGSNYSSNLNLVTTTTVNKLISHVNFDTTEKDYNVEYTVLILISSRVAHKNARNRIRQTWGNSSMWVTTYKYKIVFVTGNVEDQSIMTEMAEEAKLWKDVICLDIPEKFYFSSKIFIVALSWAKESFSFKALLKGDDNTFMNLDNIINFINENQISDGYSFFGGGYLLPNSSVHKIIPMLNFETDVTKDDAYIRELALKLAIKPKEAKGFYMSNGWCEYVKGFKVSHPINDPDCIHFLLKKSMIDNGKLPSDPQLKNQIYYKDIALLKYFVN